MRKSMAVTGSTVFFVVAPGVVAGAIPWWITRWRTGGPIRYWAPLLVVGAAILAASVIVLIVSFVRFVREGAGTPAPVAPTERLVVGSLYRYVRNPMYLAVVGAIVGQALMVRQPWLLLYAAAVWAVVAAFVRWYEEPILRERFGAEYEAYRRAVPGWLPRLRPWRPNEPEGSR